MKKINLTITGCLGRMGQQLIKSSKKNKNFKIISVTESKILSKKILTLPINQYLTKYEIKKICDEIIKFYKKK